MNDSSEKKHSDIDSIKLPFNNLFINAGYLNGSNSASKYISTIIVTILAYFTYQIFMMAILIYFAYQHGVNIYDTKALQTGLFNPDFIGVSKNIMLILLLGMFVFTFYAFILMIKRVHKKPLLSVVTAHLNFRFSRFFFAFSVWSIILLATFFIDYFVLSPNNYELHFNLGNFFILTILSILFLPIQTSFEEVFFRGYLLQGISLASKNILVAAVVTSVLFGLAHMSNPEAQEFGSNIMMPYYTLFGLFLCLLAIWNQGLELSIGIHAANNILSSLLISSKSSVLQTDALFYIKTENPSQDFIVWIISASIAFIIFQYKYRFKNHLLLLK